MKPGTMTSPANRQGTAQPESAKKSDTEIQIAALSKGRDFSITDTALEHPEPTIRMNEANPLRAKN